MELRELVAQAHRVREQLNQLQTREAELKSQLERLEADIKTRLDASEQDYENLTEEEFQMLMADLGDPMKLTVEVVYATKDQQIIHEVQLARGASIEDAILTSGLLDQCAEIDLSRNKVGIHGAVKPLSHVVADGDRIEIYRPVTAKS